jgi:transposase
MPIIAPIPCDERRLMRKSIHKTRDKNHVRRLTAMLMLHRGIRVSDVARTLCCARSSVGRWINWFTLSGVEGLKSLSVRSFTPRMRLNQSIVSSGN